MITVKKARDLYHEQNPHHCLLPDPEDENGMSSHRHQCDEWHERDRSVRADTLRRLSANRMARAVTFEELLVIADHIEKGEMW